MELEQRLALFQVFLKLYEHNPSLLDEVLELENTSNKSLTNGRQLYIQGIVQAEQVYLVTNLVGGKTQKLIQPQNVWTLGRNSTLSALPILAHGVSRRHAAVKYVENQGFYLIDLKSTNGSFVNGEQIQEPRLLKDGDRIRIGSIVFNFFHCQETRIQDHIPSELMAEIKNTHHQPVTQKQSTVSTSTENWDLDAPLVNDPKETSVFLKHKLTQSDILALNSSSSANLSSLAPKSKILNRFLSQQVQNPSKYN